MTEPDPVLADPTRERLTRPDEVDIGHNCHNCPCCTNADRPPAFAKPVRVLIYVTAVLALALAAAVVGWVLIQMWALR